MMITMMEMMTTIKVVELDDYDYDHGGSNKKVDDDDFAKCANNVRNNRSLNGLHLTW